MSLVSPAFDHGGEIPIKYTADGANSSPPMEWTGTPPGTKSLVLLCETHVNAGHSILKHGEDVANWIVYDIPPALTSLREGLPHTDMQSAPASSSAYSSSDGSPAIRDVASSSSSPSSSVKFYQGLNSYGQYGYRGPDSSPSSLVGTHGGKTGAGHLKRYSFALFALDGTLELDPSAADAGGVKDAMAGRKVLGYGKLVGVHERFFDD